jgi:ferric-dicitrate binding protein FerR (iron transport regulator)
MRILLLLLSVAILHAEPFGNPKTRVVNGRTEVAFSDETIIRAGMNARFNYVPGTREVELKSGAMLFSSPKGAGGGLLRSANVVTTTTAGDIQMANNAGTVKVICLNGKARVASTTSFTKTTSLKPGQMVTIAPGGKDIPDSQTINLSVLISTSALMAMGPLPSLPAIQKNATHQKGVPPIGVPWAARSPLP